MLRAVARIPRGRVATYAELALAIGHPRSARAVGNALNKNPHAPVVPCHRVVATDGTLRGYAGGLQKKARMLRGEGVLIKNGRVDLGMYGYSIEIR
ncbi:MAG: MGMT family protein [Nanoarchaeota archaeon]|nr:MGMT family protein [Nanoarchaeota archaeon]